MLEPPKTKARSSSSFSGVFTLKTQTEANELAKAVTTLVQRGVNIFNEVESGTSADIEDTLKSVIRLSHSFKDLTLDDAESAQCGRVIEGMSTAEAAIQRDIQAYRNRQSDQVVEQINEQIASNMQAFLSHLAELCDMMEDNQNKRGLLIIKQAVLHLQYLRDPQYTDFNSKHQQFDISANMVCTYIANRENVAPTAGPLQHKLRTLRERMALAVSQVSTDAKKWNAMGGHGSSVVEEGYKAAVVELVHCLKEAGDLFAVNGGRVKTSFNFTYIKVDNALSSLSLAVQNGSRAEATSQARVIVDALKQKEGTSSPQNAAELKKATVQLVEATKVALDNPDNSLRAEELDKVVENVRLQFLELSSPTPNKLQRKDTNTHLKEGLRIASANLSNCLSDLASPRSPRSPYSPRPSGDGGLSPYSSSPRSPVQSRASNTP